MKKLILFLLFTTVVNAQTRRTEPAVYFSMATDIRNATIGSEPTNNKAELDLLFHVSLVGIKGTEIGIYYEMFPSIDYYAMGCTVGQQFELYAYVRGLEFKTIFVPSITFNGIGRYDDWGGSITNVDEALFLTIGLNTEFRWNITEHFEVGFLTTFSSAPDLNEAYHEEGKHYRFSNYAKLIYKLKL